MSNSDKNQRMEFLGTAWGYVRSFLLGKFLVAVIFFVLGGTGTYFYTTFTDVEKRLTERLPTFEMARSSWIENSADIFSKANPSSPTARAPSLEEVKIIREKVTVLMTSLNGFPAPTSTIESAATNYRRSLATVVRETAKFDGSPEAIARLVQASQIAAVQGDKHRRTIEEFRGSTLKRLSGTFL